MAEAPLESSSTPPDSVESTRPHGDPMEDSDPQATRKRPRLDSGSRVRESLSIDDAARATSAAPASSAMDETPDSGRPASKMTINTKSTASEMPPDMAPDSVPEQPSSAPEPHQADPDATPANVISISSSPAPSPEIEVAELEDMDQDPNMSNWRPLEEALRDHSAPGMVEVQDPIPLIDSFPKVRETLGARDNLERICLMLEKGDPHDATAFITVKQWMDDCMRNLDRLTPDVFAEDRDFWEEVPMLMEYLLRRGHDLLPDDGHGKWACLEEFLLDYARITLHLVRLDTVILGQLSDEADIQVPESLSRPYLQPLAWMLQLYNIPFFRALDRVYDDEVLNLLVRVRAQVAAPPIDAISGLSEYASRAMALIPKCPQLFGMLPFILSVAHGLVDGTLERKQKLADDSMSDSPVTPAFLEPLYDMVRSIDEQYQKYITNKAPWVTSEMSDQQLRLISRIYQCFCQRGPDSMNRLSNDLSIELPEGITFDDGIFILYWGWKFGVLKKHIMEGRMELRVHGVETMQSDLVNIWRQHLSANPDGLTLPFIQYLIRFLRDNKLVDYLVGVDSHPQLISRSSNIVGFLVVTSTYTDLDTDVIWKTVTESQDSRTVSEVLSMLMRTIPMHPSSSSALVYLCSKLLELPLDRFDMPILDLCRNLLPNVRDKPVDKGRFDPSDADHADTIPLRLCVRLIRDSTATEDLSIEYKNILQEFGSAELSQLIKAGLSETDKMEVYELCVQDIAEMNQFAGGSIRALNALVPVHDTSEIQKLATEFDLTRLVVTEMAHSMKEGQAKFADPSTEGFTSRVQILARLIDMAPETITDDLGNTLWNEVLTSRELAPQARRAIWDMMCAVTHRSTRQNSFIERCIQEYLPQLRPEDYSPEILAFAKQSINYDIRFNPPSSAGEDQVVAIPGMDRIWNFILTAPPGSIGAEATNYAIEVYLDHSIICNSSPASVEATHVALVDRCVEYLKQAAATLKPSSGKIDSNSDGSMEIDSSDGDVGVAKLRFSRSLLFLRQLLHGLRTRPQYSAPQASPPRLPERPLKGSPVDVSYQWFSGNSSSQVSTLKIGNLSTATELVEKLTQLTGISKFTAFCGGQRVDLLETPDSTVKDLNLSGLLILRKTPDAHEVSRGVRRKSLTSVDGEVLKHFDELYNLLDLEDNLAREIFDFLIVFPPQGRVRELVKSEAKSEKDLFPLQRPFNALYSMSTLSTCLREEALEVSPSQAIVSHSIRVVVAFLTGDGVIESLTDDPIKLHLVANAVDCLLLSISVYRPTSDDSALVQEPAPLVQRLLDLIDIGRRCSADPASATNVHKLTCNSFAVLLEGSLRDHGFWGAVKQHAQFDHLLLSLLLEEDRQPIRNEISERIKMTCSPIKLLKQPAKTGDEDSQPLSPTEHPARIDMLATLWNAFVQIIPRAPAFAHQSAEFFKVTLWVFRYIAEKSPRDLIFDDYLKQWSEILLSHRTDEFVGRELVDDLVLGFAHLLELCLDLADSVNVTIDTFDLAEKILGNYLFPELSPDSTDPVVPQIPVMHTLTRQKLYNIISLLCNQSDETYGRVLEQLQVVVPRDYSCGTTWCLDRSKLIRAPEGYAGLKNLSNTCYLNSLLTQLFMNVEFRDFMLGLHIADPDSSQKLLHETQRLFAWMQETWMKSLDSQEFVDSIRTYDNESIDVTIQMDVDEFYNLLFDRWEAQVLDDGAKRKFRSFYGGQLVQQIKSKECPHISERMEPFSAIQCDIKGKASLEESLQAYVEGEVMQGDNKYSCTSCGRHVDAVKRACLKDVPDNLIFHLKRFDFDMVTMMRSKINDEFRFPQRIDMTPFKVEHLSDSNASIEPDVFELVGVLVHTGTAESGHYYSYIRERPTTDPRPSWVEFNDSDVSRFDPFTIADQCFGGTGESGHSMGSVQLNKVWNAYMLFYQRVSKMEELRSVYRPAKRAVPVRVPVPTPLHNHIAMENEIFIRSYCLLDPYYTFFVQNLLRRLHSTTPGSADNLKLVLSAIDIGMDTFEQVVARNKDHMGLDNIFTELFKTYTKSPSAAYRVLQWIIERPTSIRNLILKSAHPDVRGKATLVIVGAVKEVYMATKNSSLEDDEREIWRSRLGFAFEHVVSMLDCLWPLLQTVPRVWDDYFSFFVRLSEFGSWAVGVLLDSGLFVRCLEIIWLDQEDRMKLRGYYANYCRLVEKGRRFSHKKLMTLCAVFFKQIDLTLPPTVVEEQRTLCDGKFSLSAIEDAFVRPLEKDGSLSLLAKILQRDHHSNPQASRNIISLFLHAEPEAGFLDSICKTLEAGLRVSPADLCAPFLDAAWTFCQHCPDEDRVLGMIDFVAKGVESINNSGGVEHLSFFTRLPRCFNDRVKMDRDTFTVIAMEKIPDWAPTLLIDTDKTVRHATMDALRGLLFIEENEDIEIEEEFRSRCSAIGRELMHACVERVRKSFLSGQGQSVESRLVEAISNVILHCLDLYYDDDSEEDQQIVQQTNAVLSLLEQMTVEVPEDLVSESDIPSPDEWEANSVLGSDSEMGLAGSP